MLIQNRLRQHIWDRNVFTVYHECEIILSFWPSSCCCGQTPWPRQLSKRVYLGLTFSTSMPSWQRAWLQAGGHRAGAVSKSYWSTSMTQRANWKWIDFWKKTSKPNTGTSSPSQIAPPVYSNTLACEGHSYLNHHNILVCEGHAYSNYHTLYTPT